MAITSNFSEDFRVDLISRLQRVGYHVPGHLDLADAAYTYGNALHREIQQRPRDVESSDTMQANVAAQSAHASGLKFLFGHVQSGDNLNFHLSRQLRDPSHNDPLLNDWGIHHLHLGDTCDTDGFVRRTGDLLFAILRESTVYCIDIRNHGSFPDAEMVEIVHRNWPELYAQHRISGFAVGPNPATNDIARLRKAGVVMAVTTTDGTLYMSPGGGYSTARTSTKAQIQADYALREMRNYEKWCHENEATIRELIERVRGTCPPAFTLKYSPQLEAPAVFAVEPEVLICFVDGGKRLLGQPAAVAPAFA